MSECRNCGHLGSKLNEFFDFYEKDITAGRAVLISSVDDHYPLDTEFDYFVQEHKTSEPAAIPSACMSCRSANEDCTGIPCSRSEAKGEYTVYDTSDGSEIICYAIYGELGMRAVEIVMRPGLGDNTSIEDQISEADIALQANLVNKFLPAEGELGKLLGSHWDWIQRGKAVVVVHRQSDDSKKTNFLRFVEDMERPRHPLVCMNCYSTSESCTCRPCTPCKARARMCTFERHTEDGVCLYITYRCKRYALEEVHYQARMD
jgi:hypothetical protein